MVKLNMLRNFLQLSPWAVACNYARNSKGIIRENGFAAVFSGLNYNIWNMFAEAVIPAKTARKASALIAFGGASICEIVQNYNLDILKDNPGFLSGWYDPKDFAAYAIGAGTAYIVDNIIAASIIAVKTKG